MEIFLGQDLKCSLPNKEFEILCLPGLQHREHFVKVKGGEPGAGGSLL
jgi:hypothetical protein